MNENTLKLCQIESQTLDLRKKQMFLPFGGFIQPNVWFSEIEVPTEGDNRKW